jgi:ribosomal protein S18 acetylase RimI-like enzyme
MNEILVRPLTLGDVPQFRDIGDAVMREREYMAFLEGFPLEETAAWVARNLRLGNPQVVADDAGRLVGWCDVRRETIPVYQHEGMLGMGVIAAYRGRGIGTRLIEAALAASRAAGFERISLSVYGRNTVAQALYRKFGFILEGTRVRGKKVDGVYDDVLMMALLL